MAGGETQMSNDSAESTASTGLTPEQRLEAPTTNLIDAGIATIHDMATLRACVAYENANQQRARILRRLAERAQEIRTQGE
ncbi:hypothetical protein SAMN04487948_11010 [Halogranum amylolyticum]|uniref:DUF8129 domain-containing protein n=2 Tax=Halogranum amylolyticum TaxID=660520 RepID=A0A1H8U8H4_9EURY|nr:hypothetical protein SAMN04487948_11010 [Halogranum amylolyticum]